MSINLLCLSTIRMRTNIKSRVAMILILAELQLLLCLQPARSFSIGNRSTDRKYAKWLDQPGNRKDFRVWDMSKFNASSQIGAEREMLQQQSSGPDFSTAILITVDYTRGNGSDFTRVQDAIDAVPQHNNNLILIRIKPGIYREKIIIPPDKPYIILSGSGYNSTLITWNSSASSSGGTYYSATLTVFASDFVARLLSIKNSYGPGDQAVALRIAGDRAAFYGISILGYQDTILDDSGRHYFKNCFIQGATDFVCGNGRSLYEGCHLNSVSPGYAAITAQRRSSPTENTGFVFLNCRLTGSGLVYLGRPWGPYSRVVYARTYMADVILPEGWTSWNNSFNDKTVSYGEYQCEGPGSRSNRRVPWSHQLTDCQARPYLTYDFIDGRQWIRAMPTHIRRFGSWLPSKH